MSEHADITKEMVQAAIQAISESGGDPLPRAIRDYLGFGSYSTVLKVYQELKKEKRDAQDKEVEARQNDQIDRSVAEIEKLLNDQIKREVSIATRRAEKRANEAEASLRRAYEKCADLEMEVDRLRSALEGAGY